MNLGVLFSGGKDSTYSAFLAKKFNHNIKCLININSKNKYSFMFHTPSASSVKILADSMGIPIIIKNSDGLENEELDDLKYAIIEAKEKYNIDGIVSGAVMSVYQATRIQEICNDLKLEVFNPLWQKNQIEILEELIKNNFEVIIVGVFAYPLDKDFLGKKIDVDFIKRIKILNDKFKINPSGEGGEYESFVIDCPLYNRKIKVVDFIDYEDGDNTFFRELKLESCL